MWSYKPWVKTCAIFNKDPISKPPEPPSEPPEPPPPISPSTVWMRFGSMPDSDAFDSKPPSDPARVVNRLKNKENYIIKECLDI